MDKAAERQAEREWRKKRRRGAKTPTVPVEERIIAAADIPPGSRFKGYESFTVQDLKIEARAVCYRRERWLTPDGQTILAPLPGGIGDHFGAEVKHSRSSPSIIRGRQRCRVWSSCCGCWASTSPNGRWYGS